MSSFTTPIRQRTVSENEVLRDRRGRSATTSGEPRSASNLSNTSSSSKQMYTTEFIKALFGDSGVVLGDFSCSYERQFGRLYVSTNAVFFYSNLFGFEKKLKIEHRHALEIDLVRTTSLFIRTSDEEFIFRSFEDRQSVLELIRSCSSTQISTSSPPTELSSDVQSNIQMVNNNDELMSSSEHDDEAQQNRNSCQDNSTEDILVPNSLDGAMLWEQMKEKSSNWDSLVTMEKLPCKLTEFFDNCLRDSAPRSLSYFQSKVMGDSNVVLEAWAKNTATEGEANAADSLSRTIEFEHTTRWAVAKVKRRQTYQICGKHAIIQNFTYLQGIPQADTFFVEDMWLLESGSDGDIILNVKFRIVFNKQKTMLKSVISNRTKAEANEWFDKYLPFVRSQKLDQKPAQVETEAPVQKNQLLQSLLTFLLGLSRELPVFPLLVIALALYTYRLRRRVLLLEEIIHDIEMKVIQLADRISVEEL